MMKTIELESAVYQRAGQQIEEALARSQSSMRPGGAHHFGVVPSAGPRPSSFRERRARAQRKWFQWRMSTRKRVAQQI